MTAIRIDADACPVKDEAYKVAARHGLKTFVVSNAFINTPRDPMIERVIVPAGPDVADDWIAGRAGPSDVVITADIPLAALVIEKGATVLDPRGELLSRANIEERLTMRNFMDELRSSGVQTGGPAAFSASDRKAFASRLDAWLAKLQKMR